MNYLFYLLIFCSVFLSACKEQISDEEIKQLTIINNSNHSVDCHVSYIYPDTSMSYMTDCDCSEILPHTECSAKTRYGWKSAIQRNKHGVIIFFISDNDTIKKYGIDAWKGQYLILKRYELTYDDLKRSNWSITYP